MKLILLVVTAIAIFSADSRDIPGKPDMRNGAIQHTNHFRNNQEPNNYVERNEENVMNMRGKSDKKNMKVIIKKLGALDKKLTKADTEMKIEIQSLKDHEENMTDVNTELKNITKDLESLKDGNTKINVEIQVIKKNQDALKEVNSKQAQTNLEIKTEVQDLIENMNLLNVSNSKLTKANSEINGEIQAIKKNQDALKDGSSKMMQANTAIKIEVQGIKKNVDTLKVSNSQLTQANSENKKVLQALVSEKVRQAMARYPGGVVISGQYFTFGTDRVNWDTAVVRCRSLNARLAVLNDPKEFLYFMNQKYRGVFFWLGASNPGTWTWIDGRTFRSFPWPPGQPDHASQKCLAVGYKNDYDNDTCEKIQQYVCEHGY